MATSLFYKLGKLCGRAPVRVSLAALLCSLVLCLGLSRMRVETDPQALWVSPTSAAAREQARFDELFHPFFRVQQLILYVNDDDTQSNNASAAAPDANNSTDLVQRASLLQAAAIETQIRDASIRSLIVPNATLTLDAFCYKPIRGKGCLVTSPFQYWRQNVSLLTHDPDVKLTAACQTSDPTLQQYAPCMDAIGVPVMRSVVFGGLTNDSCHANPDPCGEATPRASALVVTFLLENRPLNATYTALVAEWEARVFVALAAAAKRNLQHLELTYMAQRSIADSLDVQTKQNAFIVVISYGVMFVYVSTSLGAWRDPVRSRFGLGATGIVIVLLALGAAIGVCSSLLQQDVTMITLEVVPFLILAIGVDNMFILTNEFDRLAAVRGLALVNRPQSMRDVRLDVEDDAMLQRVVGETLANVGPSILIAAIAESLAFAVGALTRIPALESFCAVAAVAVLVDFMLQVTWFAAALALDTKRVRARRFDLWPWRRQTVVFRPDAHRPQQQKQQQSTPLPLSRKSRIQTFMTQTYTPFVLTRSTQLGVFVITAALIALSVGGYNRLTLGLEQAMAVPTDFYLHEYFETQTRVGDAGPIAYIVLDTGIRYTDAATQVALNELLNDLASVREYLELPIYSWLHTFNQWRQMRFFLHDKIVAGDCDCPDQPLEPFAYELHEDAPSVDGDRSSTVTPDAQFYPLVETFTHIAIDSQCCQQFGLCGAQYEGDVVFTYAHEMSSVVTGIDGSRFRFQVAALKNQTMFVNSYYYLHAVTQHWSNKTNMRAFPYALYFVYYEQYLYIQGVALQSVLLALAVVFVAVCCLMDGNVRLSLLVTICVALMTLSQLAVLVVWNALASPDAATSINAVSVVNLLASVGLGVEFCIHLTHQFAVSQTQQLGVTAGDHTRYALASVGASIVSGITLTKICGIGVLAFAPSMLFRVYFFRMYMAIVVLGFFYGLVLLPVLLSRFGVKRSSATGTSRDDLSTFLLAEECDSDSDNHSDQERSRY